MKIQYQSGIAIYEEIFKDYIKSYNETLYIYT